ncbi:MAG TPA: UDP-N-acetylmuramoylalanyl-D-glutamyl-2,6-diaminopimelate--D-alanyl-D-alanine ligase [Methylocella sp.]|nr:UDP-N-acetylmuramoylalanyl-D-glutamyl-2,6-diaminopimelate--D-alanyl-D-alanine ligase [Methylocella sp.]
MTHEAPGSSLWTGLGLVAPLEARVSGGIPRGGISGISIDSRTLQKGDLFFAIKGPHSDGHDYVAAAFERGAAAAVVDEAHAGPLQALGPLYVVNEVLPALERLGAAARQRSAARIAAVTGSAGKTSTKEALRLVLSQAGAAHASAASYNNHWGVPLTLARMPKETIFGVCEIGMNHKGEITPLSRMARPHLAIITTVAPVHLEFFDSLDEIADAKAEIFSGLVPGGVAIINRDIAHYERLRDHAKASPAGYIATFGEHESADARLISVTLGPSHSGVKALVCGKEVIFRLGAPGRHMAMNALAVLLAAKAFGLDLDLAARALASFTAQPGRGERLTLHATDGPYTLIDETYNANPASMRAALALLGALPQEGEGRRIAVLGDMLELGPQAAAMHSALASDVLESRTGLVFAAGLLAKNLFDALPSHMQGAWRESADQLAPLVAAAVRSGDIVLIKGSNAIKMSAIVNALKESSAAASAS